MRYERSAQGLADVQKGLDELHRNAHRERRAKALLTEVRELLREPGFDVALLGCGPAERARRELTRVDGERLRSARDAPLDRAAPERASDGRFAALELSEGTTDLSYESGQRALNRLNRLEELAARAPRPRDPRCTKPKPW